MANIGERLAKAKFKEGEYIFALVDEIEEGNKETVVKCRAQPHQDLPDAFHALVPFVLKICELPDGWHKDEISIPSVSFSYSESTGVGGATITALVSLETTTSPLVINTPHLPFDQYSADGNQPTMPDDAIKALNKLRFECFAYIRGEKRAQFDLFAKKEPVQKSAETLEGLKKLRDDLRELNGGQPTRVDADVEVADAIMQEVLQTPAAKKLAKDIRDGKVSITVSNEHIGVGA